MFPQSTCVIPPTKSHRVPVTVGGSRLMYLMVKQRYRLSPASQEFN